MCSSMEVDGSYLDTIGDLVRKIGKRNVVLSDGYDHVRVHKYANTCLCPVDKEATAKKIGCAVSEWDGKSDPMLVRLAPIGAR